MTTLTRLLRAREIKLAAALAVTALGPTLAHAYNYNTCSGTPIVWNNHWTNMYISTTSFPPGSTWDADIQDAMWHWNHVGGSGFNFYYGRDNDGSHSRGNGVNEMYFSSADTGSALAVTLINYHCYWLFGTQTGIDETDVAFNTSLGWNTGAFNYANPLGSPYTFESVALHELGHVQGLNHEDRWMATMNSIYPNSGTIGQYEEQDPLADDRAGVRVLYNDGTSEVDVAGSAFKHTGSGTSGLVSSPTSAVRGGSVTIEYTFTNQGTSGQTFNNGFYLSTNNVISTGDRLLGSNTGASAGAGVTATFSRTLTIPTNITPGWYYLGFLVDKDNTVHEGNEGNNGQPMPRQIYIY